MRLTILCCFLLFSCALSKTVTKALTESLGQEVIEIGAPVKEIQPELEEEPSMEKDDDDTTKAAPATKKKMDGRRKMKDVDRIDGVEQEDDEQRVEKELADIYKDNDYKADSNELKASGEGDSVLRQGKKTDFVFAPKDINDPKQVEKFRTSPDYIDCKKKKLAEDARTTTPSTQKAASTYVSMALFTMCTLGIFYS
ncbi:uncharacterized protein LOC125239474 isoform X1 [Leguminivora glycinivorella]|uniref:uncharacterized protein LOC125239474 isoform X1 n=1 Tax=Leguminivora glycinivorella TaxID=1035111 RepID=UPI00200EA894|nr:uncharacterized protein LOC125239474 isoform X1 [Leguminivora glycinivorella]